MINNTYGIAVVCIPSDRLITDENGEQFYECLTQDELQKITQEKDKDLLKTYLFNALSMMDSTISTIATSIEKGLPIQVKILFTIKDAIKGSVLNMDNEELSATEKIVLGGVTIGIGIILIVTLPKSIIGVIVSLIISYLITWLLNKIYIYLRDNSVEQIWQDIKNLANAAMKNIMTLIESDTRRLEERKESLVDKVADEILQLQDVSKKAFKENMSSEDYDNLITLLCEIDSNHFDIHRYLECSACISYALESTNNKEFEEIYAPLHSAQNAIKLSFEAQCLNHKNEPLANKEIYAFSNDINHFVDRATSDENGIARFENILVKDNYSNSQVYFVLKQLGLDEEQREYHLNISPRITINPKSKQSGNIQTKQLNFNKHIPSHIANNDSIKPNIKVTSITNTESNSPNNNLDSITLKANYALKDSAKKYIKNDEKTYLNDSIQQHKHKTKWGYIVFNKDEDINQTLNKLNQSQPLIYSKRFKTLENIKGEVVTIPYKQEWDNKQVRFFAYLWRAHKDVGVDMEFEEQIPPNVIRIECEDGSDEFIEIVLPEENPQKQNLFEKALDVADIVGNIPLTQAKIFKLPKGVKYAYNGIKHLYKAKSLTRKEVLKIVDRLPKGGAKGKSDRIRLVKGKQELDELWEKLTQNAKELPNGADKLHNKPIYRRQLDDGVNINYRIDSKTGGEIIEIHNKNPYINKTIHIKGG